MVLPNILVCDVPHGYTSIHRSGPEEFYPLSVMVREGHSELWMENSYRILVWYFSPGHHAEVATPGAQTVENHPFLQTNCNSSRTLGDGNWTECIQLFIQLITI